MKQENDSQTRGLRIPSVLIAQHHIQVAPPLLYSTSVITFSEQYGQDRSSTGLVPRLLRLCLI